MTEHELRLLVREAIAQNGVRTRSHVVPESGLTPDPLSHAQFNLPALGTECIIEPTVSCNHCGFCKSYGH